MASSEEPQAQPQAQQDAKHLDDGPSSWLWRPPPPPPRHDHQPFFVPGYEPSAPPLPPDHRNDETLTLDEDFHGRDSFVPSRPYSPYAQENETLGTRLVDILGSAVHRVWRSSHTVLRLDIRRAIRLDGPVVRQRNGGKQRLLHGAQYGGQAGRTNVYPDEGEATSPSQGWLRGIQGGGAQLKLMQIWDFPDKETGQPSLPWNLNFGFGAKVEMDRGGRLEPQMRVRAKHVALQVLPIPLLELRGKWPLGGTRLAVNIHYRIPLLHLGRFWESPSAQLCLNLYNPLGTGFHLSPGGLEFDEHVVNIGKHTKLRIAASVDFPRQFPLKEGEQPIRVNVHRLGVKARIA